MEFVGVFRSLDNKDQFTNPLFDDAYFPECNVVFVGLEKDFIARIEMFLMGRDGFLKLRLRWNEFIEDGHCFFRRASHKRVRVRAYPIHLQKLL